MQAPAQLESGRVCRPGFSRRPKIAVILPVAYRGGTLRSAKLLAEALWIGSRRAGEDADVVLGCPSGRDSEYCQWNSGLPPPIPVRTLNWRELEPDVALRAMRFAGNPNWRPAGGRYLAPDDGIQQMCDCDLWIIVGDQLAAPLLPVRPYVLMVYDYIQRYIPEVFPDVDVAFLAAARGAKRVVVTTRFTEQDVLVYAGVPRERVSLVPMLVPELPSVQFTSVATGKPYFLWTTDLGGHKNYVNALTALRDYYELLDGQLECRVAEVGGASLLTSDLPLAALVSGSEVLQRRLRILGEIPDAAYVGQLSAASFLWQPTPIDQGTLRVVEAALFGVPCLSSRYPVMEEMNMQLGVQLRWMDSHQPSEMAHRLKWMEEHAESERANLPCRSTLNEHSVERRAGEYWDVVRECL
jgi:glycosyltransferase involved in cell wall biosynthesis